MMYRSAMVRRTVSMLVMALILSGDAEEAAERHSCSSTFQVWQPSQDVLRQIEHVQLAVQNLTSFCQAQSARTEVKVAEQMTLVHNATWRLERDVMTMQVTRMDLQLKASKLSTDVDNLSRLLDDNNRRVDDVELELYMMKTKFKDAGPRYERAELSSDMASLLKNSVGDLKAEWLMMKRDIDSLKRESRRLHGQMTREDNTSTEMRGELSAVSSGLQGLEKRVFRGEDLLHRLEERLIKGLADLDTLRSSLVSLKQEADQQRGELTAVQQSQTLVQRQLRELMQQEAQVRPKERPEAWAPQPQPLGVSVPLSESSGGPRLPQGPEDGGEDGEDFTARDCHELFLTGRRMSGVYHIRPSAAPYQVPVYCLMLNRTGYTVIQRRQDGLLNFNRRWLEYQHGFGNPYAEFWIGNDLLHLLTYQKHYTLRVELLDWEGNKYWAEYAHFMVASLSEQYRLRVSGYNGDAGDSLSYHDNMLFSTEDVDNDLHTRHCAAENQGGWWFHSCFSSNLNGVYQRAWQSASIYADGVVWYTVKDTEFYSLKAVSMMIKPKTP